MYQKIIDDAKLKMQEVIGEFSNNLQALRTGRAHSGLVEGIIVDYYGQKTPLKQMASITTPQANLIVITPWDKNALGDIENAISVSDIGISPVNDGQVVRLSLPPMTEERRNELIKVVGKNAEEARIVLRQVRQEAWDKVKSLEKDGSLTEDDKYRSEEELNKIIDSFNRQIEEISDKKQKELSQI